MRKRMISVVSILLICMMTYAQKMTFTVGYLKADTTYSKSSDLSKNIEQFDSTKLARSIEVIQDRGFKNGLNIWSPVEGSIMIDTVLGCGYSPSTPVWQVAQWASKYSLKKSEFEILQNGDRVYRNIAKTISTNPDGSFKLEIKGKQEWGNKIRKDGESWPHLYISQAIYPGAVVPIAKCENIYFSLDGLREYAYNYMNPKSVNYGLHTTQVVISLTIQNRNRSSALYGKYYTIQLPCYDFRYDFQKTINAYDAGGKAIYTGALMYGMPGEKLWDGTFKDGKWHKARKDILPLILEAWPIATMTGTPLEGADLNDFYLSDVIIGWETPGVFDASMRFKNFSIKAVIAP